MRRWLIIVGGSAVVSACMLSFDDSEVKPGSDASLGGTTSGGGAPGGGAAGADASSGGGSAGSGGAPSGGGAPNGGGGAPTGGGGAPTGGGGAPTGGGGAPTGGGGAPTGGGGAPTGGGGTSPVEPPLCAHGSDDFEDGVIGAMWISWGPSISEAGGRLRIEPDGTQTVYSGASTKLVTDMRECAVTVEVPQVLTSLNWTNQYLVVTDSPGYKEAAHVKWEQGMLFWGLESDPKVKLFDPVAHRWWRIASSAGTTKYQTSPDGKAWTTHGTTATPASWAKAVADLGAGNWQAQSANIGVALFDNFNK